MNNLKNDLLKTGEVVAIVPFSRTTLKRLVAEGKFPQPFKLSPNLNLWHKSEVIAWVNENFGGAEHE